MFSEETARLAQIHPVMVGTATACAVLALILLGWYLVRRPALTGLTKITLLFGVGVLPILAALIGNMSGFAHTQHREFCGSCHVMEPYTDDITDPESNTLAARHARNELFGNEACYSCHQDYGMFGTVMTKMGGMRHVWEYYTEFQFFSKEEALDKIELYQPYSNSACMHCHSTQTDGWEDVDDHRGLLEEVRRGETGCAGPGCHGPSHPFSKSEEQLEKYERATSGETEVSDEAAEPDAGPAPDAGEDAAQEAP